MFQELQQKLEKNFKSFDQFFYVEVDREKIYELYLEGFDDPAIRQGNNCNCCKSFLRQFGGLMTIKDGKMVSIWDNYEVPEEYAKSIEKIRNYVHTLPIQNVFIHESKKLGTQKNFDSVRNVFWKHFFLEVPESAIARKDAIDARKGKIRSNYDVFFRALKELRAEGVETVLELIAQNSLYRGYEHKSNLETFLKTKKEFDKIKNEQEKSLFVWSRILTTPEYISHIRNTSIGTLLVDLSENMDLDKAVARYEKVVAPANYKRPTSIVSPKMVEEAKNTLIGLGYEEALNRRFAKSTDISTENVLFTYRKPKLADVFSEIAEETEVHPKSLSKVEEISIDDFIANVLPTVKEIDVLLENSHLKNCVSLFTANDPNAPSIFKWNNNFSWGYVGEITDSIKERVKNAGGGVVGDLRISLSWSNYDDLDLHLRQYKNQTSYNEIYFGSKCGIKGGALDVDMNAGSGQTRQPVENIIFPNMPVNGNYEIVVVNYHAREKKDVGYTVQVECNGEVFEFHSTTNNQKHIKFSLTKNGIEFSGNDMNSKTASKEQWGLKTNRFHRINTILLSPNYWGENKTGNKHFIFALEGCINNERPRSIYNEYLKPELEQHRKVFEILGGKLKVDDSSTQVSGLGFSETQRNHVFLRVKGKFQRTLKVNF